MRRSWFDRPDLDRLTPLTTTSDGRIYGHVAAWDRCHTEVPDRCATAPRQESFASFNRYDRTSTGATLPVRAGRLTTDHGIRRPCPRGCRCRARETDHACARLDRAGAIAFHDDHRVVGYARAYADAHGIAISGAVAPEASLADRRILARQRVSGDWRRTRAGRWELTEVLVLPDGQEPAYPMPGQEGTLGLVAASRVPADPVSRLRRQLGAIRAYA